MNTIYVMFVFSTLRKLMTHISSEKNCWPKKLVTHISSETTDCMWTVFSHFKQMGIVFLHWALHSQIDASIQNCIGSNTVEVLNWNWLTADAVSREKKLWLTQAYMISGLLLMGFFSLLLACDYNVHKGNCFESIEECPGPKKKRVSYGIYFILSLHLRYNVI